MSQPVKRFVAGSVSATIFEQEIQQDKNKFKVYNTVIQRSYKDKSGQWQNVNSLKQNDIQKALICLQEAQKFLFLKEQKEVTTEEQSEVPVEEVKDEPVKKFSVETIKEYKEMVKSGNLTPEGFKSLTGEDY